MTTAVPPPPDMIALVQPLIPALRRYARAMLGDRDDADDLVQDLLERAIARWAQRREAASLRAWLFAILHNLATDQLRRRARRPRPEPLDAVPEARLATAGTQGVAIERRDLLALVAALPDEQRSVLLLVAVEDLTYAEVATVLDIPQGTVMSRLSRARERLRRAADDDVEPGRPRLRIVS